MANSTRLGPLQGHMNFSCAVPGRTPGPLGFFDQADPNMRSLFGDTPGPLGMNDWADPTIGSSSLTGLSAGMPAVETPLGWDDIKADFEKWESLIPHMYLDTRGYVTVGVGNMLPNAAAAKLLPFTKRKDGKAATAIEIANEFAAVDAMDFGMKIRATSFAAKTTLTLAEDECWKLLKKRIDNDFLPPLESYFEGWPSFPVAAKRALLDMAYNLGVGSVKAKTGLKAYQRLKTAVDAGNWKKASEACKRNGISDNRNNWTRDQFLLAAGDAK